MELFSPLFGSLFKLINLQGRKMYRNLRRCHKKNCYKLKTAKVKSQRNIDKIKKVKINPLVRDTEKCTLK